MGEPRLVIESIVARHFDEAATLWSFRDSDVHSTQRTFEEIIDSDVRVGAHLDALQIAKHQGWDESGIEPNLSDPGEAFVRVSLALEAKKRDTLKQILETTSTDNIAPRGVISAFGWASLNSLRGTVKELLSSSDPFARTIGIAACAVQRVDPGGALADALADSDARLKRRALRCVGELARTDCTSFLQVQYRAEDIGCRFWAAWSSVLTGDRGEGLKVLSAFGNEDTPLRARAMQLVLRVLSPNGARDWLRHLRETNAPQRDLLVGAGITGDPSYVPWLIAQMEIPEQARLAGEAFSMIAGVDLYNAQLTRDRPEGFESGPTDNAEDESVAIDPDQDLVWPAPELVREWWAANSDRFMNGRRYLAGSDITAAHCQQLLREGRQGHRQASAFELALMDAATPLFETRAPAFRQQRQLGR